MKIMNWNIEWMNNWFIGGGAVEWRDTHAGIASVAALARRVANVIRAVDPDVLTLQEGPSDPQEMGLFVDGFLANGNGQRLFDIFGGLDGGAQKTYMLVKRAGDFENARQVSDPVTDNFFDEWLADVDGDMHLEPYAFTRDPLVLDGELSGTGETLRLMTIHTKSKYVNRQRALWNDPNRRQEFVVAALKNRRRISTEAMHARDYLDELYDTDPSVLVVVTGDFNDGPGIDYFEKNYLTHGVADILIGSSYYPERQFEHALIGSVPTAQLYTATFDDFIDDIDNRPLLLDHILVSPALRDRLANGSVAHAEYDAEEDASRPVGSRDRYPSDHRPVTVEIS
jgi:endonuclease/exonuclease/phosphatase family metal-dependent hydrolase